MEVTSFVRTKTNQGATQVQGDSRFSRGLQRTKRKEKNVLPQNKTEEKVPQCSFKNARRHSFRTMKNLTTKNNPDSFLEVALS